MSYDDDGPLLPRLRENWSKWGHLDSNKAADEIERLQSKLDERMKLLSASEAHVARLAFRITELESRLDAATYDVESLKRDARRYAEALNSETTARYEAESRLDAAAKLCEVYWNIAVEAGVTEADIRRKRDERFKPGAVERAVCVHGNNANCPVCIPVVERRKIQMTMAGQPDSAVGQREVVGADATGNADESRKSGSVPPPYSDARRRK